MIYIRLRKGELIFRSSRSRTLRRNEVARQCLTYCRAKPVATKEAAGSWPDADEVYGNRKHKLAT